MQLPCDGIIFFPYIILLSMLVACPKYSSSAFCWCHCNVFAILFVNHAFQLNILYSIRQHIDIDKQRGQLKSSIRTQWGHFEQAVCEAATICPSPLQADLLTLKVVSESRVTWPISVPILVSVRPTVSRLRVAESCQLDQLLVVMDIS